MYKAGILNLVPILYIFIPIVLGVVIGFFSKKFTSHKIIYSILIPIVVSIVYIEILIISSPDVSNIQLKVLLYLWNSIVMFLSLVGYNILIRVISKFKNINKS